MSQHLIDTDRGAFAPSDTDRSPGKSARGAAEQASPHPGGGVHPGSGVTGNGAHAGAPGGAANGPAAQPSGDPTLRALDALAWALEEMGKDQHLLEQRLEDLRRQRSEGRSWHEILGDEEPPGTMQLVSQVLACLAKASGTLRKELVDTLRQEGVSIPAIARLFGVTHQRVSNLLRRPPE